MSLLDLKLLRDLKALKSQAFAVALVMACGLATPRARTTTATTVSPMCSPA
jgi:hypothetical protein